MCGVMGWGFPADGGSVDSCSVADVLKHRGPDSNGQFVDGRVGLVSSVLAIVDRKGGAQPKEIRVHGRTTVGVYNGEVYNHEALRRVLSTAGIPFRSDCDSEVAIAAVAEWGRQAFTRFDGQWAMATWDGAELMLARDPFGIKPLYYWHGPEGIVFASEPKAILVHPPVRRAPSVDAILDYLLHGFTFAAGYCRSDRSFYEGIHAVPPGCVVSWTPDNRIRIDRYWHEPVGGALPAAPGHALRDTVATSIRECLMGDVPVSVALSGGLDSSIIASVAAEELRSRGAGPLIANCIRYPDGGENEDAEHAALLGSARGDIALAFADLREEDYLRDLDRMIWHFDEPHWEPKQVAMFRNYGELRRRGAKVVLSGEGADELFFGYFHKFPGFRNPEIRSVAQFRAMWVTRLPYVRALLHPSLRRRLEDRIDEWVDEVFRPALDISSSPARAMQIWYTRTFLHWLLLDNDRCSMAHSLEGRFPYLNRAVVELAFAIPPEMHVGESYGEEKLLLRRAFERLLPPEIARRRKSPLPSPSDYRLHEQIVRRLEAEMDQAAPEIWEVLDRPGVETLIRQYRARAAEVLRISSRTLAGELMTAYTPMGETWVPRTPHVFALLTLLVWWRLKFSAPTPENPAWLN